ncbi:helix-turn-helix domain-containing protein [Lactobacillus gallinarum]|uniref:helix-turn-helix domain-containing protein n=1 Tax=Lactobacillus gallinarum TaxID=52242 RepID=UPI001958EBBC|nr:helix-turn-helix domain-containing protein [Lactobacillus gallinarum]MBM6958895.1 helix-turn-helix domain-containing protein [Lactobacillus gallinarum]
MNRLKELRQKNNLTLKELGQKVGMANNTLSQYETGKREPKLETWQALANFFNVTVPYLQGIDDKPNTGYSKDYIYKQLEDAYKEDWIGKENLLAVGMIPAYYVDKYCKENKISIPKDTDLDFWKKNFSFIFDFKEIKRLLTTKDKYSDNDIKELITLALFQKTTDKKFISFVEKLNEQYLKNLQNEANHNNQSK